MFIPEYDGTTGLPTYWSWSLPGALDTDAAWRIIKWSWSGNAGTPLWADGDNNLDNIRANRAALTYSANPSLPVDAAGRLDVALPGPFPGSVFTMPFAVPPGAVVILDSTEMHFRASGPLGGNDFSVAGAVITLGTTISGADGLSGHNWAFLRVPL